MPTSSFDPDTIADALLDVAAAAGVLPSDALVAAAVERLGADPDDEAVVARVEAVEEELATGGGPLEWLSGDRTAHVAALRDGIVLTHVLEDDEQRSGALPVSFDLAGFARVEEPRVEGGAIEVSSARGEVVWTGSEGWLGHLPVGSAIAVRVDVDGLVELEALPAVPPVDGALVTALTAVYHAVVDEPGLPASGEDLVLELLAADRGCFAEPQAPLDALCRAAGLERRAWLVASEADVWANQRSIGRWHAVHALVGADSPLADPAIAVLEVVDRLDGGAPVAPDEVASVVGQLVHPDVLAVVCAELFDGVAPLADASAVLTALGGAARGGVQRAAVAYLAALAAEAAGDLAAAEQGLGAAIEAHPGHAAANDRLAWFASDRGDAATALRLWRRCPPTGLAVEAIATVEPFTRPTGAVLGRNEPCWCGSGRKYKQCHLGVVAPVPLAERVGWLQRKAADFVARAVPSPDAEVGALVDVLARDLEDDDAFEAVLDDPLVLDLVQRELGWLDRFVAERGHLLPDDEAALAATWAAIGRSVHEVTAIDAEAGVGLRDLGSGAVLQVPAGGFPKGIGPGAAVLARVVPDGVGHRVVGGVVAVEAGTEADVLALVGRGDAYEIAAWVRDRRRPPGPRVGEGAELAPEAVAKRQEVLEERWCAEAVPALGGLTPREAAADPAWRDALVALLASFEAIETPPGAYTFRVDRLRALLGL